MKSYIKYALILIASLFAAYPLFAQQGVAVKNSQIKGQLFDLVETEVMYASVALLLNDSTIVNSTISNLDGSFTIEKVQAGTYKLRIDHIEYKSYTTTSFSVTSNETKVLPDIALERAINEIGEVVVTYRKPLIEIKADKLIFNVSTSPSASGTNGLDLLRMAPGVTVDMDDNIALLGKKCDPAGVVKNDSSNIC